MTPRQDAGPQGQKTSSIESQLGVSAGFIETVFSALGPVREQLHSSKNAVVPFVGSGLSRPGLPSWSEFLDTLIGHASPTSQAELRDLLKSSRYLDVASLLERDPGVGRPVIAGQIQQAFRRPSLARPAVYDLVAALPTEHFLTTPHLARHRPVQCRPHELARPRDSAGRLFPEQPA
ncbi:MAG: hypothetical protein MJE77_46215 [Proteobacteria bacterium]|nr:hypothetical protein [Pseudomonadota bacterium]